MLAIFWKEFKLNFITPFGYIFIGLFLLISGVVFVIYNLAGAKSDINGMLGVLNFASILIFPVLTMKLIADEKKIGTDRLIFTSPIKISSIILGKYFAVLLIFTICILLTLVFPVFLVIFGKISKGTIISSYVGYFFLGASYISICLFASSLTDNQITSAILGLGFLIFFLLCGFISYYLPYAFLKEIFSAISLSSKYELFSSGIIKVESFVYYLSCIVIFLLLSIFIVSKKQLNFKLNFFKSGFIKDFLKSGKINLIIKIIIFIIILILINSISEKIPFIYDISSDKIFTLSEKTKDVIKNLDKEVNIISFTKNGNKDRVFGALLDEYTKSGNNKIKYEFIDADKNPIEAKKYDTNNEGISNGMIIIECDGKIKKLHDFDIVKPDSSGIGKSFNGEQQITGAIINLTTSIRQKLYFLEGHREMNPNEDLYKLKYKLETESYVIEGINLIVSKKIPDDTDIIIVASPKTDLNNFELGIINEYLEKGGKMVFLFDILTSNTKLNNFNLLLGNYGIKIENNFVIEESANNFYNNNKMYILPLFVKHDIVNKIQTNGLFVLMPFPGNIQIFSKENGVTVEPVLLTTNSSWIRYDLNNTVSVKTPVDKNGPAVLSVAITKDNSNQKYDSTKLLIAYNAKFLTDNVVDIQGNFDFFINSVNWVEGKKDAIAIRPKMIDFNILDINGSQFLMLTLFSLLFYPITAFLIGFIVWLKRKNL